MAAPPPPPASPLNTLTPIVPRNPRIPRRGPSQHKGEPENHAQALEASPSRALTRANPTHGTPRPHHPPAPSAGCCASGSGRGVSAPNGSGRPEPAHRAPGAEAHPAPHTSTGECRCRGFFSPLATHRRNNRCCTNSWKKRVLTRQGTTDTHASTIRSSSHCNLPDASG